MANESDNNLFESLIQNILSSDYMERELYIRKNYKQIVPLVRWFAKTIVSLDQKQDSNKQTKSSQSSDEENYILYMLNLLVSISSAATCDDSICTQICDVMLEPSSNQFLLYLNRCVFEHEANDSHLGILVNFTRYSPITDRLINETLTTFNLKAFITKLIDTLRNPILKYREDALLNNRHLLSAFLTNLTQSKLVRNILVDEKLVNSLMIVYENTTDLDVKRAVLCVVRNCCFDGETHPKLISKDDNELLIKLIFPLTGPEKFDSVEMEKLPLELQYLSNDKNRERSAEMRELLLESLFQLCSTRYGRELIRESNIYLLLREYHKWETDKASLLSLENVIDVLIKTEEELLNFDNLKDVDIPQDLIEKFDKLDRQLRDEPIPSVPSIELASNDQDQ